MAKAIAIINNKGGTGKTTTTLNLGAALCKLKYKVLLIDLDSQCNLTHALGLKAEGHHVGDLLLGKCQPDDCLNTVNGLSIIGSKSDLLDTEYQINNEPGREFLLKESFSHFNHFDFILMDCPPSLGTLSVNALVAANYFIVPMQAENFAFIGLDRILQLTGKVKNRLNTQLELAGILMVKFQVRTKFSQAIVSNLAGNTQLKDKLFNSYIRQDIALMEAPAFGGSIFDYAPSGRGATDYMNVAKEFIKKYGKKD
jgi:chromosome partitioning protein